MEWRQSFALTFAFVFAVFSTVAATIPLWLKGWRYKRKNDALGRALPPAARTASLPPRMRKGIGLRFVLAQVTPGLVTFAVCAAAGWSFADLGWRKEPHWAIAMATGAAVYWPFILLLGGIARAIGWEAELCCASMLSLRLIWPPKRIQKVFAVMGICVLNPFVEEMLYRGVLVYQVSQVLDSKLVGVVLGLLLALLVHIYQGWKVLGFHLVFFSVAIGLLFSPLGLAGAIGFHTAGDIYPFAVMRRYMGLWRVLWRRPRPQDRGPETPPRLPRR